MTNDIDKDEFITILKANIAAKEDLINKFLEENFLLWEAVDDLSDRLRKRGRSNE